MKKKVDSECLEDLYELYRLEISCWCVQHITNLLIDPERKEVFTPNSPVSIFIPEHHNKKEFLLLGLLQELAASGFD